MRSSPPAVGPSLRTRKTPTRSSRSTSKRTTASISTVGPGLLHTPDDAYPLPNGDVVVADAYNCRVIWVRAHRIIRQLGTTDVCTHDPPRAFGAVNGDTPLADGGLLVSEIDGHW